MLLSLIPSHAVREHNPPSSAKTSATIRLVFNFFFLVQSGDGSRPQCYHWRRQQAPPLGQPRSGWGSASRLIVQSLVFWACNADSRDGQLISRATPQHVHFSQQFSSLDRSVFRSCEMRCSRRMISRDFVMAGLLKERCLPDTHYCPWFIQSQGWVVDLSEFLFSCSSNPDEWWNHPGNVVTGGTPIEIHPNNVVPPPNLPEDVRMGVASMERHASDSARLLPVENLRMRMASLALGQRLTCFVGIWYW